MQNFSFMHILHIVLKRILHCDDRPRPHDFEMKISNMHSSYSRRWIYYCIFSLTLLHKWSRSLMNTMMFVRLAANARMLINKRAGAIVLKLKLLKNNIIIIMKSVMIILYNYFVFPSQNNMLLYNCCSFVVICVLFV